MSRTAQQHPDKLQKFAAETNADIDALPQSMKVQLAGDARRFGLETWEIWRIVSAATLAKAGAYCPYSNFPVGCAVLSTEGYLFTGANVENASYPVGTCAERCCFSRAVTEGYRKFKAVAVATNVVPAGSPCGMCRQFMNEFCGKDVPVFMMDKDAGYEVMTIGELLPNGFGPENLR